MALLVVRGLRPELLGAASLFTVGRACASETANDGSMTDELGRPVDEVLEVTASLTAEAAYEEACCGARPLERACAPLLAPIDVPRVHALLSLAAKTTRILSGGRRPRQRRVGLDAEVSVLLQDRNILAAHEGALGSLGSE